jgi:uncharacterized protein (TIGR03437 family)
VLLEDAPVSSRFATRTEMAGAAGVSYRAQVEARQSSIAREIEGRSFRVTGSASRLVNALFVDGPASRIDELRGVPGVVSVYPMRRFRPALNRAVPAMNGPAAWAALGSASGANAGAGIKIGIIDSGIDQTHPAFQDPSLTMPAGFPIATAGHPEDASYTNNKVIVARSYVRMLANERAANGSNPAAQSQPDDYSPRDRMGHGTAVASVAAGFTNSGPGIATSSAAVSFSGMAPKAYLGNYKIYGSPGVNDYSADDVLIQAVEDAVADGMDVINLSTGSIALSDWSTDPVAAAYEAAAGKAVVVISAGDSGNETFTYTTNIYPYLNSIWSPGTAPSAITVGAILNSHVWLPSVSVASSGAPSNVKGLAAALGDSALYADFRGYPSILGANTASLIDVANLGNDGTACAALPAGSLINAFALIKQGACSFDSQAAVAQTAGAVGIVFYGLSNSPLQGPSGIGYDFNGPTAMVSLADGTNLKNYIDAHPGQSVTIDVAGIEQDMGAFSSTYGISPSLAANQLASYSSSGPTPDGLIKPDMVATGGGDFGAIADPNLLSLGSGAGMYVATQSYDPAPAANLWPQFFYNPVSLYSASGYMAMDGTSFSAPLVAGAAALVIQAHRAYTPAQVKSALVNSAAQDVTTDDFSNFVDVQWLGAGRLDAGAAVNAKVTAQPSTLSFGFVPAAGPLPAAIRVTVSNTGSGPVTLAAAVAESYPAAGASVTVSPASLTLAAGASSTVSVSVTGAVPGAGEYSGFLTLSASGKVLARVPYMYLVGDGQNPNVNQIRWSVSGAAGQDGGPLIVQVIDEWGVPMAGSPVVFKSVSPGAFTMRSYVAAPSKVRPNPNPEPACSPASGATTVTCNTDKFGFAYVDVLLGSTTGDFAVSISAGGYSLSSDVYVSTLSPAISTVQDNATNIAGTISPGSYAAIKGADLLDTTFVSDYAWNNSLTCDGLIVGCQTLNKNPLPMSMDYVSVSFDVPSAGISLPGYLAYVSPTQANVFVPWELAGQTSAQVKVKVTDVLGEVFYSNVVTVPLATYFPGFLLYNTNIAIALDLNNGLITASNPAVRGQIIQLYAGGLGPVAVTPNDGDAASTTQTSSTTTLPVVTIGGQTAALQFSGLAPGSAGLYQVNVTVPANIDAGNQPIAISIGGVTSPAGIVIPVK